MQKKATLTPAENDIKNVSIFGLGGSGIGGSIAVDIIGKQSHVPINVYKEYGIPGYLNDQSLVLACSYSGNTEETLEAVSLAIKEGVKVVCITSGGKLAELADEKGLDCILIPGGKPPRACLGYSLVQVLRVLEFFKISKIDSEKEFSSSINLLRKEKTPMG